MAGSTTEMQNLGIKRTENDNGNTRAGWTLPPEGWLKINTDSALSDGRAAVGMVVRDDRGRLQFTSAKLMKISSAKGAELAAVVWAIEEAEAKGWTEVVWSSDTQEVIKYINSNQEPSAWDTRYDLVRLKRRNSQIGSSSGTVGKLIK